MTIPAAHPEAGPMHGSCAECVTTAPSPTTEETTGRTYARSLQRLAAELARTPRRRCLSRHRTPSSRHVLAAQLSVGASALVRCWAQLALANEWALDGEAHGARSELDCAAYDADQALTSPSSPRWTTWTAGSPPPAGRCCASSAGGRTPRRRSSARRETAESGSSRAAPAMNGSRAQQLDERLRHDPDPG